MSSDLLTMNMVCTGESGAGVLTPLQRGGMLGAASDQLGKEETVWQWWLGLMVGALLGGTTGAGVTVLLQPRITAAAPEEQRQQINDLVVKRLQLVDDNGAARATLELVDERVRLVLQGPSGKSRLRLTAHDADARLILDDGDNSVAVGLSLEAGVAAVGVEGPVASGATHPAQGVVMMIDQAGPRVVVVDGAAGVGMAVVTGANGGPQLRIEDGTGQPVWSAP
jgi:hypothetical protein